MNESLSGFPLSEALSLIQERYHKIIKIVKLIGTNSKFNKLNNPYVVKDELNGDYITLFITYY